MRAQELEYDLPERLIAQAPLTDRDGARLLWLPQAASAEHRHVVDLPELVAPALWVLNDTKVIPARLRGQRPTGGRVELLLVERLPGGAVPDDVEQTWLCMGRASKPLRPGTCIAFGDGLEAEVLEVLAEGMRRVCFRCPTGVSEAFERLGELPLPPYIRRAVGPEDRSRYQTVFAREPGAVAAPTAGLHLTEALLTRLQQAGHRIAYVTLHVGPGTFSPLRSEALDGHAMHRERYHIPEATADAIAMARKAGMPVMAVGTTVIRTLEAAAAAGQGEVQPGAAATDIFIYPPYRFRVADLLLTNFHLPRSTLLALVMAFGGVDRVRAAYALAVSDAYRFFSYGDAMLLERQA